MMGTGVLETCRELE